MKYVFRQTSLVSRNDRTDDINIRRRIRSGHSARWTQQCPFVVFLDGYYYLFKMGPSNEFKTAVYRSADPMFFGVDDSMLITVLEASAAEVIQVGRQFYISSLIPGYQGVRVTGLDWVGPG